MKVRLTAFRSHGRILLSGFVRKGIKIKDIPPYFTIEIDTDTIKERMPSK